MVDSDSLGYGDTARLPPQISNGSPVALVNGGIVRAEALQPLYSYYVEALDTKVDVLTLMNSVCDASDC